MTRSAAGGSIPRRSAASGLRIRKLERRRRSTRYVLLVGDGHYDFKDAAGRHLPNLIPPYLLNIDPWLGETGADNRYVSLDGPGRLPA